MAYRVLARTYRSGTFDEIVGQEAVSTTLKNAIQSGRVHHGYFFTGTRGVGKTSAARILAKSLNCLAGDGPTINPCLKCDSCVAVGGGEDVDVVEIDAASNTGVENIRDLRSNAAFRPARARFKIYIIDEVHMLSAGAFNALLKTLEEPPEHVKFILATTDPQKVPATIQSRCQRFDFRAIEVSDIAAHLSSILKTEGVEADELVVRRIARLANGSMRDALSLLDKLLSYESKKLTAEIADRIIAPPHDELAATVVQAIAEGSAAGALTGLDNALQGGRTVELFCSGLIEQLRTMMILNVCGADSELVDVSADHREALAAAAQKFDAATYVYMISLLEELRRNAKTSVAARPLAEAAMVRLALSHQFSDISELLKQLGDGQPALPTQKKKSIGQASIRASGVSAKSATPTPNVPPQAPGGVERVAVTPAEKVTSAEWKEAAQDELVRRVQDAVGGTLVDVRRAATTGAQVDSLEDETTAK